MLFRKLHSPHSPRSSVRQQLYVYNKCAAVIDNNAVRDNYINDSNDMCDNIYGVILRTFDYELCNLPEHYDAMWYAHDVYLHIYLYIDSIINIDMNARDMAPRRESKMCTIGVENILYK